MALGTAFGQGFESGSAAVSRGLQLKQQEIEAEEAKRVQTIKEHQGRIKTTAELVDKIVKDTYISNPDDPSKIELIKKDPAIQQQIKLLTTMDQALGRDPNGTKMIFDRILSQPSPAKTAEQKGREAAIKTTATDEAKGELTTFQAPDDTFVTIRSTDKKKIDEALNKGFVEMPASIVSEKAIKITGKDVEQAGDALGAVQSGAAAIKALRDVPGAVGVPGAITDNVGGFLGSIGMKRAESAISNIFSGDDPEKVKAARSKFITFQGSMAKAILNDSRISDYERKILNDAIGATGLNASDTALIGAYKQVLAASTALARRKQKEAGKDALNLNSDKDINELGKQLVNAGLTNADAVDVIKQIISIEAINLIPQG